MSSMFQELAKELNVSETDVSCLAQSIVNDMIIDGIASDFLKLDEGEQEKFTRAYLSNSVEKFNKFVTRFKTNKDFRESFAKGVLHIL